MAYDIGPKIGMDGEADFRKSIQNINQQLRTLGSEMKAVTSSFLEGENSQEALTAQTDVLNREIDAQQKKLELLQKGLDASAQKYGETDTRTLKWAQTVNNATADLNALKAQLSKNERSIDGFGEAAEDAGKAVDNAGGRFDAFQVTLGNLVSSGIQAAISAIGNFVGALVHLDETTEEYRQAQGRLNTAFEAAGYGADTAQKAYQAFYGILGDTDTATEASQLLAQLADSEEDVTKWTEIAAGVSGTFGDSLPIESLIEAANETAKVGEVTGSLADALNWVGISEDTFNDKLAACSTESERNQLIMETLAGQYDEASDAFYRNNEALVASRTAQAQMDASLANLGERISNIKTQLASELTPALSGVVDAFGGILNGESGAANALSESISELVSTVASMLPEIVSAGVQIVGALVTGLIQSIPSVLEAGQQLIQELATGVTEALPALINSAPAAVDGFLGSITERLPQVLNQGVEMMNNLVNGILATIPEMVTQLPQIITAFLAFVTENLPSIIESGVDILMNLITGIIDTIPKLLAALPEIITTITSGLADAIPKIIEAGVQLLIGLVEGIISAIPKLIAALPQIITAIVDGIGALLGGIIDIGKSIVEGLWQGIQSMIGWIKDKVTGFISGLVDGAKSLLGIHSPSTVFAGMGKNMALGLGEGFGDEMRSVQRNINRSMSELAGPELSATYQVTAAQGNGSTQSQDTTASVIAAAVRTALQDAAVYLNGRKVGSLITQQQNASTVARGQSQVYL